MKSGGSPVLKFLRAASASLIFFCASVLAINSEEILRGVSHPSVGSDGLTASERANLAGLLGRLANRVGNGDDIRKVIEKDDYPELAKLVELGPKICPYLLSVAADPRSEMEWRFSALTTMNLIENPEMLPGLIALCGSVRREPESHQKVGSWCLGNIGTILALADGRRRLLALYSGANPALKTEIVEVASYFIREDEEIDLRAVLYLASADENVSVASKSLEVCESLEKRERLAIASYAIRHKEPQVRTRAVQVVAGCNDKSAIMFLAMLLADERGLSGLKEDALNALMRIARSEDVTEFTEVAPGMDFYSEEWRKQWRDAMVYKLDLVKDAIARFLGEAILSDDPGIQESKVRFALEELDTLLGRVGG
ncbi:MAG: hypothetical protein NUW37_13750 [Planctomycetes bacterium]|nr:hypothetical protein [Planctomycetota bacterium]